MIWATQSSPIEEHIGWLAIWKHHLDQSEFVFPQVLKPEPNSFRPIRGYIEISQSEWRVFWINPSESILNESKFERTNQSRENLIFPKSLGVWVSPQNPAPPTRVPHAEYLVKIFWDPSLITHRSFLSIERIRLKINSFWENPNPRVSRLF